MFSIQAFLPTGAAQTPLMRAQPTWLPPEQNPSGLLNKDFHLAKAFEENMLGILNQVVDYPVIRNETLLL